jgi:hypothetical protein
LMSQCFCHGLKFEKSVCPAIGSVKKAKAFLFQVTV